MLDDDDLRDRIGAAGRRRVLERFTWRATAEGSVAQYRIALEEAARERADG
jgi:glycosyltransferase involved in cell wall biosynthesis